MLSIKSILMGVHPLYQILLDLRKKKKIIFKQSNGVVQLELRPYVVNELKRAFIIFYVVFWFFWKLHRANAAENYV